MIDKEDKQDDFNEKKVKVDYWEEAKAKFNKSEIDYWVKVNHYFIERTHEYDVR